MQPCTGHMSDHPPDSCTVYTHSVYYTQLGPVLHHTIIGGKLR